MYDAPVPRGLLAIIAGTVFALGCHSDRAAPSHAVAPDETALRIRVARDEALRAGGVADLVALARTSDRLARELALRGLGRIGSPGALAAIDAALGDRDPAIVSAALAARGLAAMLDDDPDAHDDHRERGAKLAQAMQRCGSACELAGIEALGRAGSAEQEHALAGLIPLKRGRLAGADVPRAAAAAIALGTYRRRKIDWAPGVETTLASAAAASGPDVLVYAAVWALSTGHAKTAPAQAALAANIALEGGSAAPEIAAAALKGLDVPAAPPVDANAPLTIDLSNKPDAVDEQRAAVLRRLEVALGHPDWRVQVEAVRALATERDDDASLSPLALLARAATEPDPELAGELVELLGRVRVAGAADACRAHLAGAPIVSLDGAGLQWFITHTRTPHRDGRYTWVGQVVRGQDVAESLLIGDRVLRATIEIDRK